MSKTSHIDDIRKERKENKDSLDAEKQKIFHERMNALLSQYDIKKNPGMEQFYEDIANRGASFNKALKDKGTFCKRSIQNYKGGVTPCPPEILTAFADYFSNRPDKNGNINIISVDYLLGRTDHTSHGNEYIHDVIGLTDKAIDKLRRIKELNKELMPVINAIICSKKFASFLEVFKNYTWNNTNNMPFDTTDATFKKAVLQLQMENILNDISESYKRRG